MNPFIESGSPETPVCNDTVEMNPQTSEESSNETPVEQIPQVKRAKRTPMIPTKLADFIATAELVVVALRNSGLVLRWKTLQDFETEVIQLKAYHEAKLISKSQRRTITIDLQELDKQTNLDLSHIKYYLRTKYGIRQSFLHYTSFGLVKTRETYALPVNRQERIESLMVLQQALVNHDLDNQPFGSSYWQDVYTQYQTLVANAKAHDASNSDRMANKRILKVAVRKTLKSIILLIQSHYPDTYQDVLREWGFMKIHY